MIYRYVKLLSTINIKNFSNTGIDEQEPMEKGHSAKISS